MLLGGIIENMVASFAGHIEPASDLLLVLCVDGFRFFGFCFCVGRW